MRIFFYLQPRLSSNPSHHHTHRALFTTPNKVAEPVAPCPSLTNGCPTPSSSAIKVFRKVAPSTPNTPREPSAPNSRLQKQIYYEPKLGVPQNTSNEESTTAASITLDSIITEYLANQHALCKNPMATCPQFNLFV